MIMTHLAYTLSPIVKKTEDARVVGTGYSFGAGLVVGGITDIFRGMKGQNSVGLEIFNASQLPPGVDSIFNYYNK